jgi:hypothetical protein
MLIALFQKINPIQRKIKRLIKVSIGKVNIFVFLVDLGKYANKNRK